MNRPLHIYPDALAALIRAGANPLDLLSKHQAETAEQQTAWSPDEDDGVAISQHALPTGTVIVVATEAGGSTSVFLPPTL